MNKVIRKNNFYPIDILHEEDKQKELCEHRVQEKLNEEVGFQLKKFKMNIRHSKPHSISIFSVIHISRSSTVYLNTYNPIIIIVKKHSKIIFLNFPRTLQDEISKIVLISLSKSLKYFKNILQNLTYIPSLSSSLPSSLSQS